MAQLLAVDVMNLVVSFLFELVQQQMTLATQQHSSAVMCAG